MPGSAISAVFNYPTMLVRSFFAIAAASVFALSSTSHAAVILSSAGTTIAFDVMPDAGDFSTTLVAGGGADIVDAAGMDARIATITASQIVDPLAPSATAGGSGAANLARYNTTELYVSTRPTGVALTPLMATLQNGAGGRITSLAIDYAFGAYADEAEDPELDGHRVYFSLDGVAWTNIASLSNIGTAGNLMGTVSALAWEDGAPAYILWADDNANGVTDGGYTIDNLRLIPTVEPIVPGRNLVYNRSHTVGGAPNGSLMNGGGAFFLEGAVPTAFATNDVANFSQDGDTIIDVPADISTTGVNVTHATGTYTIGGAGRISGPFTKSNTGSLILTSANSFNRSTVSGGMIETRANGLGSGTVTISGGALWKVTTAAQTHAGGISVEAGGATIQTDTDLTAGGISGTALLTKTGPGALNLVGGGNGTGGINVVSGKITASSGAAFGGNGQTITLNGNPIEFTNTGDTTFSDATTMRTLNLGAFPTTIAVLAPGAANPGAVGVIIGGADSIVGTGVITKTGPGALRVRGEHATLTSPWVVNGGVLEYGTGLLTGLGTGGVTVNTGGKLAGQNTPVPTNVVLAGGELGTRSGDLTDFSGAINVTANSTIGLFSFTTPANAQTIIISGALSGPGDLTVNGLATNIDKALILTNVGNTIGGTFRVGAAQILASEPTGLMGSTLNGRPVVLSNATLRIRDDGTGSNQTLAYGNNITVDTGDSVIDVDRPIIGANTGNTVQFGTLAIGNQRLTVNGANNYGVAFSGATTLSGDATIATNVDVTLQGAVSGAFGLTKEGAARLTLQAANSYTGATTVNAGTLAGNGSVSGGVTVNTSGALAPGNNGPGIFSIGGDLLLNAGTSVSLDLSRTGPDPTPGTEYDRLAVGTGGVGASTGTVTLGGADLVLTLGTGIQENDLFFIITNDGTDPVNGIFSGKPDGFDFAVGSQIFRISYDANSTGNAFNGGNDVALLAVPEPGSAALLLLGSALLFRRRR